MEVVLDVQRRAKGKTLIDEKMAQTLHITLVAFYCPVAYFCFFAE
jgi:hypothetical protein